MFSAVLIGSTAHNSKLRFLEDTQNCCQLYSYCDHPQIGFEPLLHRQDLLDQRHCGNCDSFGQQVHLLLMSSRLLFLNVQLDFDVKFALQFKALSPYGPTI